MEIMKIPRKYSSITQAVELIYRQEGVRGFFKGMYATSILIPLNYVIYFDLYERLKPWVRARIGPHDCFLCYAIPSVVSGFCTTFVLCPLWVSE